MAVHTELEPGFLENVYQDALEVVFRLRGIPYEREKHLQIFYKGEKLQQFHVADCICYDKIIVELKAVDRLTDIHEAQVLNYLRCTRLSLGLIFNFDEKSLKTQRFAN